MSTRSSRSRQEPSAGTGPIVPSSSSSTAACSSAVLRTYTYNEAGPVSSSWARRRMVTFRRPSARSTATAAATMASCSGRVSPAVRGGCAGCRVELSCHDCNEHVRSEQVRDEHVREIPDHVALVTTVPPPHSEALASAKMPYVMVQIPKTPAAPSPAPRSVPTSADVARLAGVSRATVSYVLNNTSAVRISEPTRRRVHEAAKELGYVPHAAARSLRAGHSRMVLMPAPTVPVGVLYSQFISELQWALGRLDYTVVQHGSVGLHGDEAARAWAELRPVAVLVPGAGLGPARRASPSSQALRRTGRPHPRPREGRGRPRPPPRPRSGRPPGGPAPVQPRPAPDRRGRPRGIRPGGVLPPPPRRGAARAARHGRDDHRTPARLQRGAPPGSPCAGASSASTRCSRTTTSTRCS